MRRIILVLLIICINITFVFTLTANAGDESVNSNFSEYKVGVNDVIEIKVLDHAELKTTATVSIDGSITLPYIGIVHVKDKNLLEIEKEITDMLSEGYVKYPVVTVSLLQSRSKKVFVYGEINRPGMYSLEEGMTTVLRMFSVVGGIRAEGMYGDIKLRRRKDGSTQYKEILLGSKKTIEDTAKGDMVLQPDDILIVERNSTFLIQGEAVQRGRFMLEKNMSVLDALLQAGGVSSDGRHGRIRIRRIQKSESAGYIDIVSSDINDGVIQDEKVENFILESDDIMVIERNEDFLVQGETAQRGRFVLQKDMTVLDALLLVGGVTSDGRYGWIKVRRKNGLDSDEYVDIAVSILMDGMIKDKSVESILLQPDDILVVERNNSYYIYGEVNQVGEFVYKDGITVFQAITIAGGFNKWGSDSHVKVLRPQKDKAGFEIIKVNVGKVISGDAGADVNLKPNDTVIVSSQIF